MRLIDADDYKKRLGYICSGGYYKQRVIDVFVEWFTAILDDMPTAEPVPVVHAHWIETEDLSGDHYVECSNCCLNWWISGESSKEAEMNYCPRCGAKMDGEGEG